ncbi:glycosyltransferase family 2 protein [Desulfovibrio litoralis]|uniref:Glycosyl transferase family 2 n=1 Tax=Desulfovibrio litoralis DSM 11393 TaxID=1121455 RepID=A0A1M7SC37_9BACT|nr:glycosyltransferase family 2 protein [Desulfovibrio litoralis]SHN56048.1 Glycosyl transferase family 2 [Desulfovibrio litoralis DSM 11393]
MSEDNVDKFNSNNDFELTALILTYNSERLIKACLESLAFCTRIIVVDSHSTDNTQQIVKDFGATLLIRAWEGPYPQLQFGFKYIEENIVNANPKLKHWILCIDSDEVCDLALQKNIQQVLTEPTLEQKECTAFGINRLSWYYDRFMYHSSWHPDWLNRLFVFGELEIKMSGAHYSFHPKSKAGKLDGLLYHYPYTGFFNQLEKLNSYAEQGANDLRKKGRKGGILVGLIHAKVCFIRKYILKRGFLDGRAGFILAAHDAFYTFLKYVRIPDASWGKPYNHFESQQQAKKN